jgi:iron complex transport system ATP-binding protein
MKEILKINDLSTAYFVGTKKEKIIHQNINAKINEGELICILGLNGTGKSTLIRTLLAMQKAGNGDALYNEKSIKSISLKQLSKIVSVVLTDKIDDSFLKVFDLVATGRYPYGNVSGRLKTKDVEFINYSLKIMKASHLTNRVFSQLSDGEKQRILIARAIAQDTSLIILDEPAAFIDSPGKIGIMELLKNLSSNKNKAILMTTHDIESALRYADIIWLLGRNGEFETGKPKELIDSGLINNYFDNNEVVFNSERLRFESNLNREY